MKMLQRGFTLLEVLIAVLVVSIGLLGMMSLHVVTHVYEQSSLHRGQSAMLAREIAERMRVNVDEVKAGNYDIDTASSSTLSQDCTGPGADCSPAQITEHDLRVWSARVASLLPAGYATIVTDTSVDPVMVTVTLGWNARLSSNALSDAPTLKTQTYEFEIYGLNG